MAMNMEKLNKQLLEAVKKGDFAGVKAAVEAGADINAGLCDSYVVEESVSNLGKNMFAITRYLIEHGARIDDGDGWALTSAAGNPNPDSLSVVKYLIEQCHISYGNNLPGKIELTTNRGGKWAVAFAAKNIGSTALPIVKYLLELESAVWNIHLSEPFWGSALTMALIAENEDVANYLLSRDDFLLSDFMPCHRKLRVGIYEPFREKAVAHVVESMGRRGIAYARSIVEDIGKIQENDESNAQTSTPVYLRLTKKDTKALEFITEKIVSIDWVSDAQISSEDFFCRNHIDSDFAQHEIER